MAFARGSMRTYELLAEKAKRWHADAEIQGLLRVANVQDAALSGITARFTPAGAKALLAAPWTGPSWRRHGCRTSNWIN